MINGARRHFRPENSAMQRRVFQQNSGPCGRSRHPPMTLCRCSIIDLEGGLRTFAASASAQWPYGGSGHSAKASLRATAPFPVCLNFTEKNTKRFTGIVPIDFLFAQGELTVVMTDLSSKMKILGKPAFINGERILHNQRIGRSRFKSNHLHSRFLFHFLRTQAAQKSIRDTATGTMVRHTAPRGRFRLGASHHRNPLRLMKIMPLSTRLSSTRGLPWLLGKKGFRRSICASVSQKRLLIDRSPCGA